MRDWELASEQCQAIPRRIRRTEYLSTDENFECPEKDTDYYNTLEYRFKAKTSMQKIVAGERQPFYKFLCCHATAPKEKRRLFNGFPRWGKIISNSLV